MAEEKSKMDLYLPRDGLLKIFFFLEKGLRFFYILQPHPQIINGHPLSMKNYYYKHWFFFNEKATPALSTAQGDKKSSVSGHFNALPK